MDSYALMLRYRIIVIFILFSLMSACAKQKIILPYNEEPLDLKAPVNSVTIKEFSSNNSQYSSHFKKTLESLLANERAIKIMMSRADATVTGSLEIGRVEQNSSTSSYRTKVKENGRTRKVTKYIYKLSKKFSASVTYTVTKSGQVIGGNTYQTQFDDSWSGTSTQDAKSKSLTDRQIVTKALDKLVRNIVSGISAHQKMIEFNLQVGNKFNQNEGLSAGVKYYQQKLYSQAESYWKQVLEKEVDPKVKAAANFNLGVNEFRLKNFYKAFDLFRLADQLDPVNTEYMKAISITESGQKSEDKVEDMRTQVGNVFQLTVNPQPRGSRVRIMNIKEKYYPGISLSPGEYKVRVDHKGYYSKNRTVFISDSDLSVDIVLNRRN